MALYFKLGMILEFIKANISKIAGSGIFTVREMKSFWLTQWNLFKKCERNHTFKPRLVHHRMDKKINNNQWDSIKMENW